MTDYLADESFRRVPSAEAHTSKRFHFATSKANDFILTSHYPRRLEYSDDLAEYPSEEKARQLFSDHKEIADNPLSSVNDIAGTRLTAVFNLSQMILWERFRSLLKTQDCGFRIYGRLKDRPFDGRLLMHEGIALVYLRPLLSGQIKDIIDEWQSRHSSSATMCWWL